MSSSKGLDQLCAAACDTALGSPLPNENLGEIKVREIEAYASVADLIHAAIIYEVCEEHGRIAYRRADGSRLITSNDHWKSQVRHALYTGGRFERLPSNGEYWQLTTASRGSAAELVKVLVRADDEYLHIRATLELTPSAARTADVPKPAVGNAGTSAGIGHDTRQAGVGSARQRRKRNGTSPTAATTSIEAMCDSIDPSAAAAAGAPGIGAMRAPDYSLRQRGGRLGAADSNAPDNHSTQYDDENFDEVRDLPRVSSRAKRVSRKPTWKVANASEDDEEAAAALGGGGGGYRAPWAPPYHYNTNNQAVKHEFREDKLYNYGAQNTTATAHLHQASKDSSDPSMLRWGSTCLRSTYIISATAGESSGLSAGRTPLIPGRRALGGSGVGGGGGRVRDTSAEADSAPMKKYRQTHAFPPSGTGGTDRDTAPPSSKRQAVAVPPHSTRGILPTPQAHIEGSTAQMTPPFIRQWAEAMQHHLEEAAAVAQQRKQTTAGGPSSRTAAAGEAAAAAMAAGWPSAGAAGAIPGLPAGFPPMAMLPAMLPGLLAAAAPFFSNQQAQQEMQQQMQAILLNPGAAAAAVAAARAVAAAAAGDGSNTEEKQ
ncbi:hypothetical protein KSW81_002151 [Nannochloris sp. 'desiccata']|nr:hypothetical protein KSW81_002151 [Chlorella desiccata (nom. nud.)]